MRVAPVEFNWIGRWGPTLWIRDQAISFAVLCTFLLNDEKTTISFFYYLGLRFRIPIPTPTRKLPMLFWTSEVVSALHCIRWRSLLTPVSPLATCSVQFPWVSFFLFLLSSFSNLFLCYLHAAIASAIPCMFDHTVQKVDLMLLSRNWVWKFSREKKCEMKFWKKEFVDVK